MNATPHIVCPHCNAVNRVPAERLAEGLCGQCKSPLFTQHPVALTQNNFERHIGRSEIPVLVDFWAPWCGPCRMMAPQFEQAAALLEPRLRLSKVDTESEPSIATRFQIRSIPTLVLFVGGKEVARQSGAMDARGIAQWAQQQLIAAGI